MKVVAFGINPENGETEAIDMSDEVQAKKLAGLHKLHWKNMPNNVWFGFTERGKVAYLDDGNAEAHRAGLIDANDNKFMFKDWMGGIYEIEFDSDEEKDGFVVSLTFD